MKYKYIEMIWNIMSKVIQFLYLWLLGNFFSSFFVVCWFFFKIIFFEKLFQGYHQSFKQFGYRPQPGLTFCPAWSGSKLFAKVIRVCNWKRFSYFSPKTYVVGTQKDRLIETVLLSTHNIYFRWEIRKLFFWYALLTTGLFIGIMLTIMQRWQLT